MINIGKSNGQQLKLSDASSELFQLRVLMEGTFKVVLPHPEGLDDILSFKKFCSGLLERKEHPWEAALSSCSPVVRSSVAASLFLFRKRLPSPADDGQILRFAELIGEPSSAPLPEFQAFCRKTIRKIFRSGWDRRYHERVTSATLPLSSVLGSSRAHGGARSAKDRPSRERYQSMALGMRPIPFDPRVKVVSVNDGGKDRLVTVGSVHRHVLKPLHTLLYDHLSKQGWLLRGDATPKSFRHFQVKPNEVFVSGDYESATDNLSLELYEYVLKQVLETSDRVPASVKEYAVKCARSELYDLKQTHLCTQRRGQLMGNLLSFPFLCLTNYLAFKFAVGRKGVPVKINGDDIVFRSTREECDDWMAMVGRCGLTLSKGKTLVDGVLFSLNSSFFRATSRRPKWVPFIRSKALFARPESLSQFTGQYSALCPGLWGKSREDVRALFLMRNRALVDRSQRSLSRGLRVGTTERLLRRCGLWDRELFYTTMQSEPPVPSSPSDFTTPVPAGCRSVDFAKFPWTSVPKSVEAYQHLVLEEMVHLAWTVRPVKQKKSWTLYWENVHRGTFRYPRRVRVKDRSYHFDVVTGADFPAWLQKFKNSYRKFWTVQQPRSAGESRVCPRFWYPQTSVPRTDVAWVRLAGEEEGGVHLEIGDDDGC